MDNCKEYSEKKNARSITLNNNIEIPLCGLGTGIITLSGVKSYVVDVLLRGGKQIMNTHRLRKVIEATLEYGLPLFDTSKAYGKSEKILGKSINKYNREDVFIITKLSNTDQRKGDIRRACMESLKTMNVDYIDLYLMHWPQTETYLETWIQMEEIYKEGLVKAIGVSNFHKHHLEKLLSIATVVPSVNEIERHPLLNQEELIKYCKGLGIRIIAYTPIGRMHEKLINNKLLKDLSKKYKKSIAQIILRWHFQEEIITIPNTFKVERLKEYLDIFNFELSLSEMDNINSINENYRLRYDPDNCDFNKL